MGRKPVNAVAGKQGFQRTGVTSPVPPTPAVGKPGFWSRFAGRPAETIAALEPEPVPEGLDEMYAGMRSQLEQQSVSPSAPVLTGGGFRSRWIEALQASGDEKAAFVARTAERWAEYNERDAADVRPVGPGEQVIWRVECPCCGLGPFALLPAERAGAAHFADDPTVPAPSGTEARAVLMRISQAAKEATGSIPTPKHDESLGALQASAGEDAFNGVTDPEALRKWFGKSIMQYLGALGFEVAGYAVPADRVVTGGDQVLADRRQARRLGHMPVFQEFDGQPGFQVDRARKVLGRDVRDLRDFAAQAGAMDDRTGRLCDLRPFGEFSAERLRPVPAGS